jgi:hypothetical protein
VLFFAKKMNSKKIFAAWIILFIIWLVKYFLINISTDLMIWDLVGVFFIFVAIFLNIFFFKWLKFSWINFLKILHIFWMILIYFSLLNIFDFSVFGANPLIYVLTWIFLSVIWILLNILKESFLKKAYIIALAAAFIFHISNTNYLNNSIIYTDFNYYYNYIFSAIALWILVVEHFFFKDSSTKWIYWISLIYFISITSLYLYNFTSDAFSLTIYWGVLALVWVHLWIVKTNHYMRWVWLYLLVLTLLKIVFYDVWNATNSDVLRIIAFICVWAIMIYMSILYSKNKLSLKKDFVFER